MKKIFLFLLTCTALNAQSIGDTLALTPVQSLAEVNLSHLDSAELSHQNSVKLKHRVVYIETGIMAATGKNMPFWLRSNQYGIITPNANALATVRGGYYYNHDLGKNKKADWGFGINAVANLSLVTEPSQSGSPLTSTTTATERSRSGEILLPEAYARIRYKWFDFFAGRKREIYGLVDSTLSSGSYIWSGNALPMPKIQIGWTDYKPIIGKGFISLKGSFAHGWFGEQTSVKNYYLHQKTLYGRIGRANAKVQLFAGFNHQVQWGGTPKVVVSSSALKNKIYPSDLSAYILAISGVSLGRLAQKGLIDTTKFAQNDAVNRIGNHLGSIDLGMKVNFKEIDIVFYRQNIYDDGSLFYLANIEDGLNGITLEFNRSKVINKIVFEYLQTTDQGKSSNTKNPTDNDNYFNNSQYIDGWTYNNLIIGNAFLTSKNFIVSSKFDLKDLAIPNNRIKAGYIALAGRIKSFNYKIKSSYSLNYYSSYPIYLPLKQFSFGVELKKNLKNNNGNIIFTSNFDKGQFFLPNFASSLILRLYY